MIKQKVRLVGIKGTKGSGKDTISSMISYILNTGITNANFGSWNAFNKDMNKECIIHFADKIKKDISEICNIELDKLNDSNIKENYYYNFKDNIVTNNVKGVDCVINDVPSNLSKYLQLYKDNVSIKIRTLLQYYGTEVLRNTFWEDASIRYTINKAFNIVNNKSYCIISDVRFKNESDAIYKCGGIVIHNLRNVSQDKHISECIANDERDYVIKNDGNLFNLFYEVYIFVKEYMI